jgi:hypothetical protein
MKSYRNPKSRAGKSCNSLPPEIN